MASRGRRPPIPVAPGQSIRDEPVSRLLERVRSCTICTPHLPLGPRPLVQFSPSARILVVGQAPSRSGHRSGLLFDGPSGERLREWMGISKRAFYDPLKVAILPMGFCYPGGADSRVKGGDLPPRPECAPAWHWLLLRRLAQVDLVVAAGKHAHDNFIRGAKGESLTETVRDWRRGWPTEIPLPHPSPKNNLWLRRSPWFAAEVVPALQERVREVLAQ